MSQDYYPGRKLPFAVKFSAPGEPCPRYVSHIEGNRIILKDGANRELESVAFTPSGRAMENEDLFSKLVNLNQRELPFAYKPKDMYSPDWLMMGWQESGKLAESFRLISWRDQQTWNITLITPPVAGIRGWTGPT
jgi:hypothetical protein